VVADSTHPTRLEGRREPAGTDWCMPGVRIGRLSPAPRGGLFRRRRVQVVERESSRRMAERGTAPIGRVVAGADPAVKAGVGPVARAGDQAVADRVIVDGLDVPFQVVLVADGVLPVFRMEDAAAAVAMPAVGDRLLGPAGREPETGETGLDPV